MKEKHVQFGKVYFEIYLVINFWRRWSICSWFYFVIKASIDLWNMNTSERGWWCKKKIFTLEKFILKSFSYKFYNADYESVAAFLAW